MWELSTRNKKKIIIAKRIWDEGVYLCLSAHSPPPDGLLAAMFLGCFTFDVKILPYNIFQD